MADILAILVQAEIDIGEQSINKINKSIKDLEKKVSSIKVKVDIDNAQFKELNSQMKDLSKNLNKSLDLKLNPDKAILELNKVTEVYKNGQSDINKRIKEGTNLKGQQVKVTQVLNESTKELEESERRITTSQENQRKSQQQMDEALIQTQRKRRQEEEAAAKAQAKYINKSLEDSYKLQQQEERRVANLNKKIQDVTPGAINWEDVDSIKAFVDTLETSGAKIDNFKTNIDGAGNRTATFTKTIDVNKKTIKEQKMVLDENTNAYYQQTEALKNNAGAAMGLGEQLKIAISRTMTWALAMTAFYGTLRKVQEGIQFIAELDKNLNNIRVITGQTHEQTVKLAESYAELGYQMGKTVLEISSVSSELYRQGLAAEEVSTRLQTILQLSAIEGISTDESMSIITSSVNALGEDAEKTTDVLLKAGAISASSAADIGTAMTKMASSAKMAGLSIEQTSAMLSTLIDVTQESPETLGNSLKSIIARFNKINEETGEINAELNDVHKAFSSVEIAFTDTQGQIRPVGDLLTELAGKWDTLDKNTQAYISTQVAGTNHSNRFVAVMDNYNKVLDYQNQITNSAGTTQQQYAIYLDSVEAAANRTQVAFEGMFIDELDSNTIKKYYDFATAIIKIIDWVGLLNIGLGTLSFVFLSSRDSVTKFTSTLIEGFTLAKTEMATTEAGAWALGVAFDGAKIKAALLQGVLTLGLSVAFAAVIQGVIKLVSHYTTLKEEQIKLIETQKAEYYQNQETIGSLESLNAQYENATKGTEEYHNIQKQMADIMPQVIKYYDAEGKAVYATAEEVRYLIDEQKRLNAEKAKTISMSITIDMEDDFKEFDKAQKKIEKLQQEFNNKSSQHESIKLIDQFLSDEDIQKLDKNSNEYKTKLQNLFDSINQAYADFGGKMDPTGSAENLFKNVVSLGVDNMYQDTQQAMNESKALLEGQQSITSETLTKYADSLKEYNNFLEIELGITDQNVIMLLDKFADSFSQRKDITEENYGAMSSLAKGMQEEIAAILSDNNVDLTSAFETGNFDNILNMLIQEMDLAGNESEILKGLFAELEEQTSSNADVNEIAGNSYNDLSNDISSVAKGTSESIDALQKTRSILEDLNENGMSLDLMKDILDTYPEMHSYLNDESKIREELTNKIKAQENALSGLLSTSEQATNVSNVLRSSALNLANAHDIQSASLRQQQQELFTVAYNQDLLTNAMNQNSQQGYVNKATMEALFPAYSQLRNNSIQTANGYNVEQSTLIGLNRVLVQQAINAIKASREKTEQQIADTRKRLEAVRIEAETYGKKLNIQTIGGMPSNSATAKFSTRVDPMYAANVKKYTSSFEFKTLTNVATQLNKLSSLSASQAGNIASLQASMNNISVTVPKINASNPSGGPSGSKSKSPSKNNSSTSSGKSAEDKAKEAFDNWVNGIKNNSALVDYLLEMNKVNQEYEEAIGNMNEHTKLQLQENDLYKEQNRIYQSNITKIKAKMKTVKTTSDEYSQLNDLLEEYTQNMRQNEVAIVENTNALKEYDKQLRDNIIEAQELVYEAVKNRAKLEYETDKQILDNKIEFLNKEKQLLRDNYEARKQIKEEEKKQEELANLEKRYNKISVDNSGMFEKEKLDLQEQISSLREEIYEDSLAKEVENQEKAIDSQIDQYETQQEMLETQYNLMEESAQGYWNEVDRIMKTSQSNILTFLKENSEEYKQAGKLQREAYLEGWGETIETAKDIMSGETKTSTQISKEMKNSSSSTSSSNGSSKSDSTSSSNKSNSSSSSSSKPKVSAIKKTLHYGIWKDNDVKTLQKALNQILGTKLTVDGNFGNATTAAVKQFQKKYKLAQDGSVGSKTKAKFKALGYNEGGMVDYTGLAIVHGSKEKPEAFLNANQVSLFKKLTEVLSNSSLNIPGISKLNFTNKGKEQIISIQNLIGEVNVNVEKLEDEADYDKIGKKVTDNIYNNMKGKFGLALSVTKAR